MRAQHTQRKPHKKREKWTIYIINNQRKEPILSNHEGTFSIPICLADARILSKLLCTKFEQMLGKRRERERFEMNVVVEVHQETIELLVSCRQRFFHPLSERYKGCVVFVK